MKHITKLLLAVSLMLSAMSSAAQYVTTNQLSGTSIAPGQYYNYSSIVLGPVTSITPGVGQSVRLYIADPDCQLLTNSFSQTQNYIVTSTPRTAMTSFSTGGKTACDLMQMVQYFDGLGRPLQTVQVKGSTASKDVVQPFVYDQFGREAQRYLPYAAQGAADGSYKSTAISDQNTFYSSPPSGSGVSAVASPFSLTNFEPSPLNRVTEQGAPGTVWQPVAGSTAGHTNKMDYTTNNITVLGDPNSYLAALYTVTINSDQSRTLNRVSGANYPAGQLYVTISKDENWVSGKPGTTEEYKDKEGHVVLKRTFNQVGVTVQILSTYYVYDDLGNLAFVLPPNSNADAGITSATNQTTLDNLCYQYQYDERNRVVQKKLPGKDWEYMVYNLLDQVIFTQDGNQRNKSPQDWSFTKYDALGRVIMTGTEGGHTETRQGLQDYVTTTLKNTSLGVTQWEVPSASGTHGYTNTSFPSGAGAVALTVNYYDDYSNLAGFPGFPTNFTISGASQMTRGLLTASKTAVLNNPSDYLWTVHYYDDKGRETQLFKQHYLGGIVSQYNYDQVTNTYNDITSELTTSKREHYIKNTNNTDKVKAVTILNSYAYDHMGRKTQTKEQINGGANVLLSQTDYNEIGQMQAKHLHGATGSAPFMQDIAYAYNERGWLKSSTSPLFALQLTYNNGNTAPFNGNISNQTWQIQGGASKSYNYTYDALNRLTAGIYTPSTENYNEQGIDYDLAGNIQHLTRQTSAYTYNYTGNQLQSVSGLTTGTYQYDPNGNAKYDARKQATIAYNLLNLPQTVTATGVNLSYTYDAEGKKLRKNNGATITDYIDGIQYENGNIIFIQTEEGRAINNGGNYIYEYTLTDHLGNNRLSFDQNSATVIRQQDDYYPFGMEISRGTIASPKNDYLYNKKELQTELGQYDYGARFYDPVIGRWTSVDPLAEKMRRYSPYNYAFNNPIRFIDPDGMSPPDWLQFQGVGDAKPFEDKDVHNDAEAKAKYGASVADISGKTLPTGRDGVSVSFTTDSWDYVNAIQDIPYEGTTMALQDGIRQMQPMLDLAEGTATMAATIVSGGLAGGEVAGNFLIGKADRMATFFDGMAENASKAGLTDFELVSKAATKAENAIGGSGNLAGIEKHTYAKNLLDRYQNIFGDRGLRFNEYFNNNAIMGPGNRGFLDVVNHQTMMIYDFKFGSAVMSNAQFLKYSNNFIGYSIQVIRP